MTHMTDSERRRLIRLIERQLVDAGCCGDDEQGCTRDDADIPLEEWCLNCLVGRLLQEERAERDAADRLARFGEATGASPWT